MNKTYSEKLKDPRWQKKRLGVLKRDKWTCQGCGNKKETLHVHHINYKEGRNPWDIETEWLLTLCAECHKNKLLDGQLKELMRAINSIVYKREKYLVGNVLDGLVAIFNTEVLSNKQKNNLFYLFDSYPGTGLEALIKAGVDCKEFDKYCAEKKND